MNCSPGTTTVCLMPSLAEIQRHAADVLGPVELTTDLPRRTGRVVAVTDTEGREWVVKSAPTALSFAREVKAYRRWVPAFADQAPALRHADPRLRTMVIEKLPGHTGWTFSPDDHTAAGRLLERIHASRPARPGPGVGTTTAQKLRSSLRSLPHPGLVDHDERDFLRQRVRTLRADFEHLPTVPTHGDFGGHNWLRDGEQLRVIDFSLARFNAAAADFARLFIGPWWQRPELPTAFFEGYGREPTAEEMACVRLTLPVLALGLIGHGHRHGHEGMERRGRDRLRSLMDGVDFTTPPAAPRRTVRAVRRLHRSLRSRP